MAKSKIKVATCQFAVSDSISRNSSQIRRYMHKAKTLGAQIVHFPECALSGYAGTDFRSFNGYSWDILRAESEKILKLAGELGIWVILPSSHRLSGAKKPHNSLYLINNKGVIVDRYDKRFCTPGDLEYYTPGDRFVHFEINGVRCSLLICYDLRFPEVYRQLCKEKVECVFQSFYNARQKAGSIHTDIMRQTMQCRAATNYMWVSMANSSGYYSPYPSCFIQPDGKIAGQLDFNKAGMMFNTVDTSANLYDASGPFREAAMNGKLTNGCGQIEDQRSQDRKSF